MTVSIFVILITLVTVGSIVSYQVTTQAKSDYFNNSLQQMKLVEASINSFYDQLDKDINMMATNNLVMNASTGITSYAENEKDVKMTPSIQGGLEQEIYEVSIMQIITRVQCIYISEQKKVPIFNGQKRVCLLSLLQLKRVGIRQILTKKGPLWEQIHI